MGMVDKNKIEGPNTCLVVPTAHHKFDHLIPIQRLRLSHNAERREPPVDGVQPQMRREMVREIVFALDNPRPTRIEGSGTESRRGVE